MASTGTPLRVTRSKFAAASVEATLRTSGMNARQAVSAPGAKTRATSDGQTVAADARESSRRNRVSAMSLSVVGCKEAIPMRHLGAAADKESYADRETRGRNMGMA